MAQIVSSTQIDAKPEAVWAILTDARRVPEWVELTERMIDVPDAEPDVGYVYTEYGGIKPFLGESEWRITEFDPFHHQRHIGDDGTMTMDLAIDVVPTNGGTQVTMTIDLKPRWYMVPVNAILWPLMMRKRGQQAQDQTLANLKRLAESAD